MSAKYHSTVSLRLTPQEHTRLRAFAAARGKSVSQVMREMIGWAVRVPDADEPDLLAEAVLRVAQQRRGEVRGGLFRLGEDRRIKHLDEGSVLEGVETEGSA